LYVDMHGARCGNRTRASTLGRSRPTTKPISLENILTFVPGVGIEPTSLARHDFKSCAYTYSATRANSESLGFPTARGLPSSTGETAFSRPHLRRRGESNPRVAVLQTAALPLRHYAI
jgi:hypothetical protein